MIEPRHHQRILLVEDEAALRRIVAKNLRARGFWVEEADSAEAALSAIEHARPCLVFLDIDLPGRTGWDVLRALRQRTRRAGEPATAVVLVTATQVHPDRVLQFAPDAVLPKPFPMDALTRLAAKYCTPTEAVAGEEAETHE